MINDQTQLAQLRDFYAVANAARNLSARTISWYGEKLTAFIAFLRGGEAEARVRDFTPANVERFVNALRDRRKWSDHPFTPTSNEPVSASYVQGFVRALRAHSSWLYEEGYTAENRLARFRLPRAYPPLIQPLRPEEIHDVLGACQATRDTAIVMTLLDSGLRASELIGLRCDDARVEQYPATLLVLGKGGRQRLVPVEAQTQRLLQRYKHHERPEPLRSSTCELFLTTKGEPLSAQTLKMIFDRLRRRSGVARLHPHLLRHTFAALYLSNGGDLLSLQFILGHRSLEMVRRYAHIASGHVIRRHREFSPVAHLGITNRRPAPKPKERSA